MTIEQAFEAYRANPNYSTGVKLQEQVSITPITQSLLGPSIAIMQTLLERNHCIGISIRDIEKHTNLLEPDRPGWNDYFMARWLLTKELEYIREIHRRMHPIAELPNTVIESARWMVASYRQRDAEFDEAMTTVQLSCLQCQINKESNSNAPTV